MDIKRLVCKILQLK